MSLVAFYHWDGTTKTDVSVSVIDFKARRGIFPDLGAFSGTLTYPVLDGNGNQVTLEKGDVIWPVVFVRDVVGWSVPQSHIPFQGLITNARREGDFLKIEAESLLAPLTRMSYTLDNSLAYATDVILDILSKYTPPLSTTVGTDFVAYRNTTGSTTWPHDATTGFLNHGAKVDVKAVFQYLSEQPVHLWLQKPPCALYPTYEVDVGTGLPILKIGYSGYKNYRQTDVVMSYDSGILSNIEWEDPTESVLNDVTIKVLDGGSVQLTDATSIAAYGQRQTTLLRSIFVAGAVGSGYSAWNSAKAILESMKDPQKRCRLTCEITALLPTILDYGGLVGLVYQIVDDVTGITEDMCLRSMTYNYPAGAVECEFDNAPLNMATYGMRMENRVTTLESVMPNQTLDTTSSPTFQAITLDNTIDGKLSAYSDGSLELLNSYGNFNFGPKNANYSYFITDRAKFAMNKPLIFYNTNTHDIGDATYSVRSLYLGTSILMGGNAFLDASRNITCANITPHAINTCDLGTLTNYWNESFVNGAFVTSIRSMDQASLDATVQIAQSSTNNIWLRFRRGGASASAGALFSNYDANHFWLEAIGADLSIKYGTTLVSGDATQVFKFGSTGALYIGGDLYINTVKAIDSGRVCTFAHAVSLTPASSLYTSLNLNRWSTYVGCQINFNTASNVAISDTNCHWILGTTNVGTGNNNFNLWSNNGSASTLRFQVDVTGKGYFAGGLALYGATANTTLSGVDNGLLNVQTSYGYLKMGPNNTTWCHFYTDLTKFYFNKGMDVTGNVDPYSTGNYDLGTSSKSWRSIYLGTGLYMGGTQVLDASRNLSINDLTVAGVCTGVAVPGVTSFNAVASANTRNSFDATSSFLPGAVYVKRKTITFTNGLGPGTYRVYFEAAVQSGGGIVYARVYKNGSAIGTARSTSSTTFTGWSQDFSEPLNPGDTIELWAYHSGDAGYYGYVRYFRVQYDLSLPTAMPAMNS